MSIEADPDIKEAVAQILEKGVIEDSDVMDFRAHSERLAFENRDLRKLNREFGESMGALKAVLGVADNTSFPKMILKIMEVRDLAQAYEDEH
jgi:hypothetical protein